ncbi:hypothetical protein ACL7TT_06425 [Microbulbifer sp. 2304DJ12-6]|uniref:hypothetical protein n=1 Tax=Microbulbifer sp. 2304DJ12-6 TaxID=3233340 RepID=UPI0039AF032D
MNPLRSHLEAVASALQHPAMKNRARGHWDHQSTGPIASIAPPAESSAIRTLERKLGRPLPATLEKILTQVSSNIEFSWFFPAKKIDKQWGLDVETQVTPPERFLAWDRGIEPGKSPPEGAIRTPKFISGALNFGVNSILAAGNGFPWVGAYDYMRDISDTPEEIAHLDFIEEFMGYGFPVFNVENGDWLAIDLRDSRERLLYVSHECEDAGIELDLTLPQFLTHLTWLGPIPSHAIQILDFSTSVKELVPGDFRILEARFDADSEHGTAWRKWFWQNVSLAHPHPSLLERS